MVTHIPHDFSLLLNKLTVSQVPIAADARQASTRLEEWAQKAKADHNIFAEILLQDSAGVKFLKAIFGNSPFLSHSLLAEMDIVYELLAQDPASLLNSLATSLNETAKKAGTRPALMSLLRRARRRHILAIALADLAGWLSGAEATRFLSEFADQATGLAVNFLLRQAAEIGHIQLKNPALPHHDCGYTILGLGKLGGYELNYSSDIDLIILYDRERLDYRGPRSVQDFCVRLTRELVQLLQEQTADGFVFRVDLRLRPDPASTPLALSVQAAETYYEGMGQNWERAAMIKARPIAGDIELGQKFLQHLRPFVWRRHLDFAAIQDIHSIKRQIHAAHGFHAVAIQGHNIKVGRGGIREIEFFAQTQQLIWGGREPNLRVSSTTDAIIALMEAQRVAPETASELIESYWYLRHIEHRLQLIEDRQTQTLPEEEAALTQLALFAGHRSVAEFSTTLLSHLTRVQNIYAALFQEAPSLSTEGNLVFTGTEDDRETILTIEAMGFPNGQAISNIIRGWHFGRYRAMRSTKAREILTELTPSLLKCFARTSDPHAAFTRFDTFLGGLPAGVQLFSLLQANPQLMELIAEIMGSAPRLALRLGENPALLDAVLTIGFFDPTPPFSALQKEVVEWLARGRDWQDQLDLVRRWANDKRFQTGVRLLRNQLDGHSAGKPLTDIAEAAITALMPLIKQEFEKQHGHLPGRGLAILALGKLGGMDMTVSSDIDLIFIYDLATEAADRLSDGKKPLAAIQYYARLAQRFISSITAPTGEGRLYEVDMRLRPSGNSGPIASQLQAFARYQMQEAWTWEHMALTKARVIYGEASLQHDLRSILQDILARPRDAAQLRQDVFDMREKIARHHGPAGFWRLKYRRGGLIDLEFLVQYLQLQHATSHPEILHPNTEEALSRIARAKLLPRDHARYLIDTLRLWHRLQGFLRLTLGSGIDETELHPSFAARLAEAGEAPDLAHLKAKVTERAQFVYDLYRNIINPTLPQELS